MPMSDTGLWPCAQLNTEISLKMECMITTMNNMKKLILTYYVACTQTVYPALQEIRIIDKHLIINKI